MFFLKKIAVFFGGKSCEHDVSVITGVLTLNSLDKNLFEPVPVFISGDGKWYTGKILNDISVYKTLNLKDLARVTFLAGDGSLYAVKKSGLKKLCEISLAINCLHGVNGEDGTLAGVLKLCGIPSASPDLFASAFSMDKDFTKIVLQGLNVERLPYLRLLRKNYYEKKETAVKMIEKKFSYPVIVKPANAGSSIGISVAAGERELSDALSLAFSYDDKVIIERALKNFREINCAAYRADDKIVVSECEEPVSVNEILTFKDKYLGSKTGAGRRMPADISKTLRDKIRSVTERIYRKADFTGVIRIDYIIYENKVFVNEINTVPGSLAYYLFSDTMKGFSDMLTALVKEGLSVSAAYYSRNFVYESNVLKISGAKGAKSFDKTKKK